jgi:hypothetical protein
MIDDTINSAVAGFEWNPWQQTTIFAGRLGLYFLAELSIFSSTHSKLKAES